MIHVERSEVSRPIVLESERIEQWLESVRNAIRAGQPDSAQNQYMEGASLLRGEVMAALTELFHGKCAFCETPLDPSDSNLDHFRPIAQAINLDGSVDREYYWWLAYEWENLYPSCPACNQMKGSRFPTEGPRALVETLWDQLPEQEKALLLDPCSDEPERDLVLSEDGSVVSSTRKGQVTIEVYGLNRSALLEARRHEYAQLQTEWQALLYRSDERMTFPDDQSVEVLTAARRPYAALRRQYVGEWMSSLSPETRQLLVASQTPDVLSSIAKGIQLPGAEEPAMSAEAFAVSGEEYQRYKSKTIDQFEEFKGGQGSYNLKSDAREEAYFMRTRLIERIEIRNFRILRELDVRLGSEATTSPSSPIQQAPTRDDSSTPWMALLGENGSGKSSVLHAVALVLAGDEYRRQLPLKASEVLTHGEQEGSVRVWLTGGGEPIELRYRRGSDRFESSIGEPKVLFLAYGATRLLPRGRHKPKPGTPFARADNLLDPFVPLQDADSWLIELDDERFQTVTNALRDLLALEDSYRFVKNFDSSPPHILVDDGNDQLLLRYLSDGFQSVVALACDIMAVMLHRWPEIKVAEGIVLIDELEAHLHPRWKQQIAASLRRTFPRIQFLYSTHDPLCLQNARPGEVQIMTRDPETGAITVRQQDVPPGLRADQILTGWWFGLSTTRDDDTLAKMEEHRRLLEKKTPENDPRRLELETILRQRLGSFAETSVERLAQGVAAEVMAGEQKQLAPEDRQALRKKVLDRVKELRGG